MTSYSDRLGEAIRSRNSVLCVGIDPRTSLLPIEFGLHAASSPFEIAHAFAAFSEQVLELVEPHCRVVKPQAAFFEMLGAIGVMALEGIIAAAHRRGMFVILDAKRGDIASTAEAYADATLRNQPTDAVTVNPYLGEDAVEPFITTARSTGKGLFVLVRTSNPGSGLFQNLSVAGRPLYRHVAEAVERWNAGKGDVGAVVGATHPAELAELRQAMPGVWFLVPGYGAQGGSAADVSGAFDSAGFGAIVNSSRGITFPCPASDPQWKTKIIAATCRANAELNAVRTR